MQYHPARTGLLSRSPDDVKFGLIFSERLIGNGDLQAVTSRGSFLQYGCLVARPYP